MPPNKLFHTLVLMGAALTHGACGDDGSSSGEAGSDSESASSTAGMTSTSGPGPTGSGVDTITTSTSSSPSETESETSAGASTGVDSATTASTTTAPGSTDSSTGAGATTDGGGTTGEALPDCAGPGQIVCETWEPTSGCACDEDRPATAEDCEHTQQYTCEYVAWGQQGVEAMMACACNLDAPLIEADCMDFIFSCVIDDPPTMCRCFPLI